LAVATKVKSGTITSSPGPTPAANKAACNAAVPEFTAIACLTPINSANKRSNSLTLGPPSGLPVVSLPDLSTSSTADISSSLIMGLLIGISFLIVPPIL